MEEKEKLIEEAEKRLKAWKPTRIHFGEAIAQQAGEIVKSFGKRVLIVLGRGSVKKSGSLDLVLQSIQKERVPYGIVGGVEPNPSKETVYRIAYHILAGDYGLLLAVGGGSVIDAAKAAGILGTTREGEIEDYFGSGIVSKKIKRILDLIAVPTTSGTGSELTKFSVITDKEFHVKKMISDPVIVPLEAIVDPVFTYSCDHHVTKVTGLDAMSHLIEGYFNNIDEGVDPEANRRALIGLRLLFEALPRVLKDGLDREARKMMSLASTLGGSVIFYKQAGLPHLNSFSWSHVMDHGEAVAVMLPYYTAYYAPMISEKIETIGQLMGIDRSKNITVAFIERLLEFYRKIDFPTTLKEFRNFSVDLIQKATLEASQNRMKLEASPRIIPQEKSEEILQTIIECAYQGNFEKILKL